MAGKKPAGLHEVVEMTIQGLWAGCRGTAAVAVSILMLASAAPVSAFNFGNMMNPGTWFGGGDRYDDYGPYGYPPPPPPAYGYGAGYGVAPYTYAPTAAPAAPAPTSSTVSNEASEKRIRQLEKRIQELEAAAQQPQAVPYPSYSSQVPAAATPSAYPPTPTSQGPALQPHGSSPESDAAPQGLVFRPLDLPDTHSAIPAE